MQHGKGAGCSKHFHGAERQAHRRQKLRVEITLMSTINACSIVMLVWVT
jgi:hypothetical protein